LFWALEERKQAVKALSRHSEKVNPGFERTPHGSPEKVTFRAERGGRKGTIRTWGPCFHPTSGQEPLETTETDRKRPTNELHTHTHGTPKN